MHIARLHLISIDLNFICDGDGSQFTTFPHNLFSIHFFLILSWNYFTAVVDASLESSSWKKKLLIMKNQSKYSRIMIEAWIADGKDFSEDKQKLKWQWEIFFLLLFPASDDCMAGRKGIKKSFPLLEDHDHVLHTIIIIIISNNTYT